MATARAIMWFRRDLRLGDHPALAAAAAEGLEVVPLFVDDPAFVAAGAPRRAFLHDCLRSLDRELRERAGTGLVLRRGDPTSVVPAVAAEVGADTVLVSRDHGPYGRRRDAAVSEALATSDRTLRGIGSPYAVTPGAVLKPDGSPYAVFTPFSRRWREIGWAAPVPEPDVRWAGSGPQGVAGDPWPERPDPGCELPPAGERAALESWAVFLTSGSAADGSGRAAVDAYGDLRDRPGLAATSRMSPHLKWGTIHPRTLLADLDPSGAGPRGHTKYSSELAWREFYADVLFRRPESAWWNLDRRMDAMPIDTDAAARERFRRWCAGRTGFGMVDAGMAELAATGWMHNRARMVVASFLVKDLHLPWQWGARHFLEHLVDGDLASNNHGWQWTAGTGTDAAPYFRIFNPATQRERYDPDGEYVARWVRDPAPPMLDHAAERDEALRRLAGLKTGR